jgi:hypothetical protein
MPRLLPALPLLFAPLAAAAQDAPRWSIVATLQPSQHELLVAACSDQAQARVRFFAGVGDAPRHLREARRDSGAALAREEGELHARDWRAGECLHTRIDLLGATRAGPRSAAWRADAYYVLDPRRWLWRPAMRAADSTIAFDLPEGWAHSVPWPPQAGARARHRLGPDPTDSAALTAFGRFEEQWIERPGGRLRLALLLPWSAAERARVEPVVDVLLQATGRLPRADAQLLVLPLPGERAAAPWGQSSRGAAPALQLYAGADAPRDALLQDWTATHELVHLFHPSLGARGRWLGEGLASYWQEVLRARAGVLTPAQAWARIDAGFARGRAEGRSNDLSLSQASRRAGELRCYLRVYWSGAAFWFEADLALRARGSSLDDVLGRYAGCCLADTADATPEAFVAQLDRLAGADVFATRYARYAEATSFPPVRSGDAPAALRAAIMRPRSPP